MKFLRKRRLPIAILLMFVALIIFYISTGIIPKYAVTDILSGHYAINFSVKSLVIVTILQIVCMVGFPLLLVSETEK